VRITFRKSFARDLKKVKDRGVLDRIAQAIEQVDRAATRREISDLKKLSGTDAFYRIRVGEYRIGAAVEGDVVEFVRCLSRRELYRFFP
jgi:mRNA interferase RelE/StbE